jgi:MoaA/NifB/PqqE/SkfB family radical SAM enzyme
MNYAVRSTQYDFANILFAGPCNACCYFCIGRQIDPRLSVDNLREFPPRNLDRFVELISEHDIQQIVFTGTTTDPQLYQHEARLLDRLRQRLAATVQISLHTNGRLALKKIDVLNQYDRVCISFPTFDPATYVKMMGTRGVPDLAHIVERAQVPVKVSCVIDEHNRAGLPQFLARCHIIGIKRLVLRRLYGDQSAGNVGSELAPLLGDCDPLPRAGGRPYTKRGEYRGNPVYDYQSMEVTVWDFDQCDCRSLNLFSDGTISSAYLLAKTRV